MVVLWLDNFQCLVSDEKFILRGFSDAIVVETFVHIRETPFEDARNKLLPYQIEIPNNANFLPSVGFRSIFNLALFDRVIRRSFGLFDLYTLSLMF